MIIFNEVVVLVVVECGFVVVFIVCVDGIV